MVSIWVLLSSFVLECMVLQSQVPEVSAVPYVFNFRDLDGNINKSPPSKKYSFPNPISWVKQYKRESGKRGFSFPVPTTWSSNYKRGDFTFSLPGYWSHTRLTPSDNMKRASSDLPIDRSLQDLQLCDDLVGLKTTIRGARNTIAKLQDDCATRDMSLDTCLTAEDSLKLKQLFVTAKKGAELLGWCLAESDSNDIYL